MDLGNLQDHIVTTHKSKSFKKKVVNKLKSVMDIPKKQGFTMVQTVQKNGGFYQERYPKGVLSSQGTSGVGTPIRKDILIKGEQNLRN